MEEEKNELLNMYLGAATLLRKGKIPSDLKIIGKNSQGYPILESKEGHFSIQCIVINIGLNDISAEYSKEDGLLKL